MASNDAIYHEAMLLRDEPRLQSILPQGAILCGEKPVRVVLAEDFDAMRQRVDVLLRKARWYVAATRYPDSAEDDYAVRRRDSLIGEIDAAMAELKP